MPRCTHPHVWMKWGKNRQRWRCRYWIMLRSKEGLCCVLMLQEWANVCKHAGEFMSILKNNSTLRTISSFEEREQRRLRFQWPGKGLHQTYRWALIIWSLRALVRTFDLPWMEWEAWHLIHLFKWSVYTAQRKEILGKKVGAESYFTNSGRGVGSA